jgi:hypothetical protein
MIRFENREFLPPADWKTNRINEFNRLLATNPSVSGLMRKCPYGSYTLQSAFFEGLEVVLKNII